MIEPGQGSYLQLLDRCDALEARLANREGYVEDLEARLTKAQARIEALKHEARRLSIGFDAILRDSL